MALVLYRPAFWFLLVLQALLLLWLARRVRLRWWPAWILRVLLMAFLLFSLFSPRGELFRESIPQRQVMVVDQSDSISSEARHRSQQQVRDWQAAGPNRLVVVYGSEPEPVLSPQDPWPEVEGLASNTEAALQLTTDLLGDTPGRAVLVSDGVVASAHQVDAVVERLLSFGHTLDVIRLPTVENSGDLFVGSLWVPSGLWEHTPFHAVLPVHMPAEGEVTLRLEVDGEVRSERLERLPAGQNYVPFAVQAQTHEIMTLAATALLDGDPRPENNRAFATVQVFPSPRVLLITQDETVAPPFAQALAQSGVEVGVLPPGEMPTDIAGLDDYQVIVLHNLLAENLSGEQMLVLEVFVSRMGKGVVFLGGRNSYTLGGYQSTVLEPMMPVRLEPPPREERPPMTLVLAVDRSSSMALHVYREARPIQLAREAAMRAVETLDADDYLGVLTYGSEFYWDVPIGPLGDGLTLRQAQDAISRVSASGGTKMYAALQEVVLGLGAVQGTESRHVLLLSDGISSDGTPELFQQVVESAQEQGVTISTIALGPKASREIMCKIAGWGRGRCHVAVAADELPRIMISESRAAQAENVQMGQTSLIAGETAHPILFGTSPAELPTLSGYNALTSRADEGAEDVLLSASFQDPLLSVWQYGLGRVVAWMGDIGEEWATEWVSWSDMGLFWAQVLRYALPDPAFGPAQVDVQVGDTTVSVNTQIQDTVGAPVNLAQVLFSYADEEDDVHTFSIPQVAPGAYELDISRPTEGAYRAVVRCQVGDEEMEIPAPLAVNYPPEWEPADAEAGKANLLAWASTAGGREVQFEDLASVQVALQQPVSVDDLQWLVLALVVMWPIEIALRRRWLPWT